VGFVAKRCVLEQKLPLTASIRSRIMRNRLVPKLNDLELCLEVVSRSCQPLRYIRKPLEIEVGSKGLQIGNSLWGIKWSRDPKVL